MNLNWLLTRLPRLLALVGSFIVVVTLFQNCGIEQPRVENGMMASSYLSPANHQNLGNNVSCSMCHESARPAAFTAAHNFNHFNSSWVGQDCVDCHTNRSLWGTSWAGGQFMHSPYPSTCIECHANQMPRSVVYVSNDMTKPITHTAGVECSTCHNSTSKFDTLSDWRPASSQPSGLVGNRSFNINLMSVTFSGAIMTRSNPFVRTLKLEIDHGESQVGELACAICHTNSATSGTFAGARFHQNILVNPTTCVQCHANARPVGVVGSRGNMRHEAVAWTSNAIGAVSRGTTAIVGNDCVSCHLNAASMPTAGAAPQVGSMPFSGANFHGNTAPAALSSCLDCHAQSRPTGSSMFTDLTWKNKTNVGGPPFTTFDLARHAPNVDCVTCHTAPSVAGTTMANWAVGNFAHQSANMNCLNCHTNSGITSTSHTGFTSNCVTCHVGAASAFPNPTIADWKVNVTGGVPVGVVGEITLPNAFNCTGVLGALPNCTPSSPNVIAKGMDHAAVTNGASCVNCHGTGAATSANGRYHRPPVGVTAWVAPASADLVNCNRCHDPTTTSLTVVSIKDVGIVGSLASASTGVAPFAGVWHKSPLIAGQLCSQCHTAPTQTVASTWNSATKIHVRLSAAQITTCVMCHYKRMPSGALPRKNQVVYKGTNNPQKFIHNSVLSMPTVAGQECSICHADDGKSWTSANLNTFHNRVASTSSCNTCHVAPSGTVTSSTSGLSFDHGVPANVADCASCHSATLPRIAGRIPTASDWDGGVGAPTTYTIPSHTSSGITVPGFTGIHSTNTNCAACHTAGNYKQIIDFDHQGLPANQNSCVSCHLGSKADVVAYVSSTAPMTMKTIGDRHHPTAKFNGTQLSCVGCHTVTRGATTFNNANGVTYPTNARQAYVSVGCGSVSGTTFSCHEGNQRVMVLPSTTGTSGRWK